MKEIKSTKKTGYLKRVLIKICRIFGYELIDQSTLDLPVSSKSYEDTLSVPGNKSISKKELMPLLRQRPSNFSFTFKGTSFNDCC